MHSTGCDNATFPDQALERRQAQETLTDCAEMHNKFHGTEHSSCINVNDRMLLTSDFRMTRKE
jgi:hypothetical protein